jgi:hypothetical protein
VEGQANAKWKERLDGWLANTKHIYLREYYFCGCIFYPRPIADSAAVDLRYCRDRGVDAVYTDLAGRYDDVVNNATYDLNRPYREFYDMVGMEAWTIGKLFWDPSLDPEALRAKYIRLSFGPAAAGVAEFYRLLRESWYSDTMVSSFCDNPFRSAAHYIVEKGIADKCRAALAAAAQAQSVCACFRFFFRTHFVQNAGFKRSQGFFFVALLRAFILALRYKACGQMGDSYRAVSGVHSLAAVSAGAENIDAQILFGDVEVIVLVRLREYDHRGGACMDTAHLFSFRNALDAVAAAFVSEFAVRACAFHSEYYFLVSAKRRFIAPHHAHLPSVVFAEARIHPEKRGGEKGGFLAACSGANLENGIAFIKRIGGQKTYADIAFGIGDKRFDACNFRPREFR